ncbi:transcriptional regulator [Roseibium denhamense]|uniref:Transcriptional regulator, ArsR family n=1 Tax=Roseibium denhamense TaxID=76305 RepID=A0ABY1NBT1_9HYPH|nr:metalloregulator ArsR/SmtB family transcription factor [Roseibium denhamense]MTI06588.1 transcriptional regulator [Roseibium denhamense]SMP05478.1 transcriptional regulator, ArsR family [Roseibium denhamense]
METEHAVTALGALAQTDRLAAFRLLMAAGEGGLPSGEIAQKLDIQPTRMSFHLASLERAGLFKTRRAGRQIIYAVDYGQMRQLLTFLMEDCCGNNPAVCCFPIDDFSQPEGR